MSRQNKVNPGMYTQRGRLTQDDAAREIAKQRNVGSPHTWQPVQRDQKPPMIQERAQHDDADDQETETPAAVDKEPARAKAATPATRANTASRSAQPAGRRPAKTAAQSKKGAPRKSAPRKSGLASKATTSTRRSKAAVGSAQAVRARSRGAKTAAPARAAKGRAQSATRKKTNRGKS